MHRIIHVIAIVMLATALAACDFKKSSTTSTNAAAQPVNAKDSISLSWTAPSTRADGSYLAPSELAGYKVYVGTSQTNLSLRYEFNDSTVTNYTVNDLPAGSYYVAVTAYDSDGVESGYSQIILVNLS